MTSLVNYGNGGELPYSSRAGKKFRAAWEYMEGMEEYGKDGRWWQWWVFKAEVEDYGSDSWAW